MKQYEECFVVFLDILGFKSLINSKRFEEIKSIFESIITGDDAVKALSRCVDLNAEDEFSKALIRYNKCLTQTKIYIMSDSIVIASACLPPEALAAVVDICNVIQIQLYDLETPIMVRGAIAKGDFFIGKGKGSQDDYFNSLIFGKGLVDAYIAQEYYAVYPRIIISEDVMNGYVISVDDDGGKLPKDEDDGYYYLDTLMRYVLPHPDNIDHNVVGEPITFYTDQFEHLPNCGKMRKFISEQLSGYNDSGIRKKYLWLDKEMERIKSLFLSANGINNMAKMFAVATTQEKLGRFLKD